MKTKDLELGGFNFKLTALPGDAAIDLFYLVIRPAAPAFAEVLGALEGFDLADPLNAAVDAEKLSGALRGLFGALPPADFKTIRNELFKGALVTDDKGAPHVLSQKPAVDFVFGELGAGAAMVVMWECLKLNYQDFFAPLIARARAAAAEKARSSSSSPKGTPTAGRSIG